LLIHFIQWMWSLLDMLRRPKLRMTISSRDTFSHANVEGYFGEKIACRGARRCALLFFSWSAMVSDIEADLRPARLCDTIFQPASAGLVFVAGGFEPLAAEAWG
jgi:hypothetical protein